MIKLENISKMYGDHQIFNKFNLDVKKGEFIAIKGESGKGKTTLLNIIGGILSIDEGSRYINAIDYTIMKDRIRRKIYNEYISFVFQEYALLEENTIYENLLLILKITKNKKKDYKNIIQKHLKEVGLEYLKMEDKISQLSGGEKQRLAIIRCILSNNNIILADEPTGSLDEENSRRIMNLLQEENKKGKTIILVTHNNNYDSYFSRIITL